MNKTNNNFRENMEVIKEGKIPENITSSGNTKSATLSVKLTAEENNRFTADLERSGMSSKTDYVKHRLFNSRPVITLDKGREIFEKLSECANLLHDIREDSATDQRKAFEEIAEQFSKIETDIGFIMSSLEAVQKGLHNEKGGE